MELVLASRNAHKLRELRALLAPHDLVPLPEGIDLPPELGESFADNALGKARAGAHATARPTLGEDSGIVVAALGGGPGIRSARYAGEDASDDQNLWKLLGETDGASDRSAAYVCALALVAPGDGERLVEGRCEGRLARAPRGSGGFGYDPIFLPADVADGRTMAELSSDEKNSISHRGRAAAALLRSLEDGE
jgi:XTP/dITP diphosphohydrolase